MLRKVHITEGVEEANIEPATQSNKVLGIIGRLFDELDTVLLPVSQRSAIEDFEGEPLIDLAEMYHLKGASRLSTSRTELNQLKETVCPVRFEFLDKPFVVEIQYFLTSGQQSQQDIEKERFVFAVTTDGADLILDMKTGSDDVLQRESGDIDFIGITLRDLLGASRR